MGGDLDSPILCANRNGKILRLKGAKSGAKSLKTNNCKNITEELPPFVKPPPAANYGADMSPGLSMASQGCWRCLLRYPTSFYPGSRLFSTTPVSLASPIKAKKIGQDSNAPRKGVKSLRIKKKGVQKSGKPPAPGERKAMRKRIVLSNTNALEVKGMQDLSNENMMDEQIRGTVVGLPDSLVNQLRAVEAFRTGQGWGLFRRPGVLMRGDSLEIAKALGDVGNRKKTLRRIYTGERGSGKSIILLQAISVALLKDWVVVTIPEGMLKLFNS